MTVLGLSLWDLGICDESGPDWDELGSATKGAEAWGFVELRFGGLGVGDLGVGDLGFGQVAAGELGIQGSEI